MMGFLQKASQVTAHLAKIKLKLPTKFVAIVQRAKQFWMPIEWGLNS
jgi:hypothetical protein